MHIDAEVDATGLNCPLPILKAKKALAGLDSGQILRITATDPGSMPDFHAFARQARHELLEASENGGIYRFVLRKA